MARCSYFLSLHRLTPIKQSVFIDDVEKEGEGEAFMDSIGIACLRYPPAGFDITML